MAGVPANAGALVGTRLGNYHLVALLALGGTAEIYLARIDGSNGFEKYVVVKCLHDHLAEDPEFVQMFLDEARLGAQLGHSNIVQTLGLGEHEGRYYLVMEFIAGMSLALLARRAVERVPGGRIPVPLVLGIAAQACAGLHYAHDKQSGGKPLNLVHRDISPQNLVITFEGDVRIVDFGIAKAEERETATKSGTIKGKFAYMSPEQCHAKDTDRRTDVFALGVVIHELLTGRRLFKRASTYETYQAILECKVPPPSSVNHELDPALDAVVLKALTKDPAKRYQTAEALGDALTQYLHSRGKLAGAAAISAFISQYFMAEIEDHGDRMRELLEGRAAAAAKGWDDDEPGSTSMKHEDAEELSQFEVVDGSDVAELDGGDDDELPAEATRIEMNPMALMDQLAAAAPPRPAPPRPASPSSPPPPVEPAAVRAPAFGSQGGAASIFGGSAQPHATPAPARLPGLSGRPTDRTAPAGVPAITGGAPTDGPFGASGQSTVIMESQAVRTPPKGFAAAPEAHTVMAPVSPKPASARGLPASFEARIGDTKPPVPAGASLAFNATVPAMDVVSPDSAPPADVPTYRAPHVDPVAGAAQAYPSGEVQAYPSGEVQAYPSGEVQPYPSGEVQPYPSGELLVAPYGTPRATNSLPETTLPPHLTGGVALPPPTAYPRFDPNFQHPKLTREFPGWIVPVGITVAVAVVIGVLAAVAG
ncbi:MAG: protein kinase [Kofleriaceae bacterium]